MGLFSFTIIPFSPIDSGVPPLLLITQGKPKEAAVNAIGAVPGGKVFKGMKALGAGKRLSRLGSATQSLARYDELPGVNTSNPFSRGVNKVIEKGSEYVGKAYKKIRKK